MRKEVLTPEELAQLYEDTRRELGIDHTDD